MSSSFSFFLENLGELECRRGEKIIFSLISCLLRGRLYFRWHKEEVFFQEIPFCAGGKRSRHLHSNSYPCFP